MRKYLVSSDISNKQFLKGLDNVHLYPICVIFAATLLINIFFIHDLNIIIGGFGLSGIYFILAKFHLFDSIFALRLRLFLKKSKYNPLMIAIGNRYTEQADSLFYVVDNNNKNKQKFSVMLSITGLGSGLLSDYSMDNIGTQLNKIIGTANIHSPALISCKFITQVFPHDTLEWDTINNDELVKNIKNTIVDISNQYNMYLVLEFSRLKLFQSYMYTDVSDKTISSMLQKTVHEFLDQLKAIGIKCESIKDNYDVYNKLLNLEGNYENIKDYKTYCTINNNFYMHGVIPTQQYPIYPVNLRYISSLVPSVESDCIKTIITDCQLVDKVKSRKILRSSALFDSASILEQGNKISTGESELSLSQTHNLIDDLHNPDVGGVAVSVSVILSSSSLDKLNNQRINLNKLCDAVNVPRFQWTIYNNLENIAKLYPLYVQKETKFKRNKYLNALNFYSGAKLPSVFLTTAQYPALLPIYLNSNILIWGTPIGIDIYTGESISVDAHVLYRKKIISSPNILVLGDVGGGKSSLVKCLMLRGFYSGKHSLIIDRKYQYNKGEYRLIAELCNSIVLHFGGDNSTCINILDPIIPVNSVDSISQLELLYLLCRYAKGDNLTAVEKYVITYVHKYTINQAKLNGYIATIRNIVDVMFNLQSTDIEDNINNILSKEELQRECLTLTLSLKEYIDGTLSGLVDDVTSSHVDWTNHLIIIDTSKLIEASSQLSLVTMLITTFISTIWSRIPGDKNLVLEEGYNLLSIQGSDIVGHMMKSLVKRGRGIGLSVITIIHHISDIYENSALYSLVKEVDIMHIFRQSKTEDIERIVETYQIPDISRDIMYTLNRGEHILNIHGYTTRVVQHIRSDIEIKATDTDF